MDGFGSGWIHRENVEELKKKLIQATYELELERYKAYEKSGKNLEDVNRLIQLWKIALEERDEARDQLQKLLTNNSTLLSTTTKTQNNKFIVIPNDVRSDIVSNPKPNANCLGSLIIDGLIKGKALPKQGELMQAVLEAGPLLESLMVAGPLPKWRNPPPINDLPIPFDKFVGNSGTRVSRSHLFVHEPPNGNRRMI